MRPLEMLEMVIPAEAALRLNSSPLYRMQDGILTQVRVSTLLLLHTCPPTFEEMEGAYEASELAEEMAHELVEATPAEIEADYLREVVLPLQRREREAALAREARAIAEAKELARQHVVEHRAKEEKSRSIDRRIASAIRRHGETLKAYCPRCDASEGMVCINAAAIYADGKRMDDPRRYNNAPHQERIDYAIGSGVMELTADEMRDYVPKPQVYVRKLAPQSIDDQRLRQWLGMNAGLWRPENWATTSILDALSSSTV